VILSQLANARANITILVGFAGFAGLAGLANHDFLANHVILKSSIFSIFLMFMIDQNTREGYRG